jgi:glycosyltransferase involved in cell wall biosynthesis
MIEGLTFEAAPEAVTRPLVSLIVPVLNEQDAVIPFVQAIDGMVQSQWPVLEDRPRLEIIFVDDGSTDAMAAVLRGLCAGDKRVKLVQLSRNFGKEATLSAGLKASRGDAVVPMDVDLQDPPELLRPMIDRWQSGVQVVNARRCDRSSDTMFKRSSAQLFYKAINSLADHPIAEGVGDFRLFDRAAVDALNQMTEHSRFNKGLLSWIGFRTETLDYVRP